ncbi:MAG: BamA/TamA family outer membrane protein [Bacteroidota bacterium]
MATASRLATFLFVALLLTPIATLAQNHAAASQDRYRSEIGAIQTALRTVVDVLEEATLQGTDGRVSRNLQSMANELTGNTKSWNSLDGNRSDAMLTRRDLDRLEDALKAIQDDLNDLKDDLRDERETAWLRRVDDIEDEVDDALDLVRRANRDNRDTDTQVTSWTRNGQMTFRIERDDDDDDLVYHGEDDYEPKRDRDGRTYYYNGNRGDEHEEDGYEYHYRYRTRAAYSAPFASSRDYDYVFVGEFDAHWPYRETALYRHIPAIRYNRVEGLVIGLGLNPLDWYDYQRSKVYGQVGRAFALESWRYEIGVETRPANTDYRDAVDVKVGGSYRRNTVTNDIWKSSWIENSLAAILFENDFFDYYEVEGWNVYATSRLADVALVSAGFRAEDYTSLTRNTRWSIFGGDAFRINPAIQEGFMQSLVFAFEGGLINSRFRMPEGVIFRTEVEIGQGVGGDFSFNRYVGDVRAYLPMTRYSTLSVRVRGGVATGNVPLQKQFTIGGVGTVRAYPQNSFLGTRVGLFNAEYAIEDVELLDDLLDDLQVFGFFDAGWTNRFAGTDTFDVNDLITGAGAGVSFWDRVVRLELAFPLRDINGLGREPTLWLRLNPTF